MTNNDSHTGTLISDLVGAVEVVSSAMGTPTPAQWQSAKRRPTQFGDNKNTPSLTRAEIEDDMERDRR